MWQFYPKLNNNTKRLLLLSEAPPYLPIMSSQAGCFRIRSQIQVILALTY